MNVPQYTAAKEKRQRSAYAQGGSDCEYHISGLSFHLGCFCFLGVKIRNQFFIGNRSHSQRGIIRQKNTNRR